MANTIPEDSNETTTQETTKSVGWRPFRKKAKKTKPKRNLNPEITNVLMGEINDERREIAADVAKNDIKGKIANDVDITPDFQRTFANKYFALQSKRAMETAAKGYFEDVKSWENSTSGRTRLVVIEVTQDSKIETLAQTIFNASPLERVLITGLKNEDQKQTLKEKLKELWQDRASKITISDIEKQLKAQSAPLLRKRETRAFVRESQSLLEAWTAENAAGKRRNKKKAKQYSKQLKALQETWAAKHATPAFGEQLQSLWDELASQPENKDFTKKMDALWDTWAAEHATPTFNQELKISWTTWALKQESSKVQEELSALQEKDENQDAIGLVNKRLLAIGRDLEKKLLEAKEIQEKEKLLEAEEAKEIQKTKDTNRAAIEFNPFATDQGTVTKFKTAEHNRIKAMELKTLMGPHLVQENLDISYDTMNHRFPQSSTNIVEVLCLGESTDLATSLSDLGRKINGGVPIFPIKSKPFEKGEDPGLWRCASQQPEQFLAKIAQGKTGAELLGKNAKGGYDDVSLSEHFEKFLDFDKMPKALEEQGVIKEAIDELSQEDLKYIKSIFFDYAVYHPGVSPDMLEVTRSKSKSLQAAQKSEDVARSLLWNIVERPVSTALEVDYGLGLMALGGGGDIASEDLRKRNAYKLFFEAVLQTLNEKGIPPKEGIAIALSQTLKAYVANEKKNSRIHELERGKMGAHTWRALGVKYANKVKKSNRTGVEVLSASPLFFAAEKLGGPLWTGAGFITKIGIGLSWMLGGISAGITTAAATVKGIAMSYQVKANKKYLNIANDGLAIANERMLEAQDERKTELAKQLGKIQKSLNNKEENVSKLQKKHKELQKNLADRDKLIKKFITLLEITKEHLKNRTGDVSDLQQKHKEFQKNLADLKNGRVAVQKELDDLQTALAGLINAKLKEDTQEASDDKKLGSSTREEHLGVGSREEKKANDSVLPPENEQKLLTTLKTIQEETPFIEYEIKDDVIDPEVQLRYTKNFYESQAKRSAIIAQEAYRGDLNFWMESGPNRARLLVIEADDQNLEELAKSVRDTSPIERLLVAGLSEDLKPRFEKKLKELWKKEMNTNPIPESDSKDNRKVFKRFRKKETEANSKYEGNRKEQLRSDFETKLKEQLRSRFEKELKELCTPTVDANPDQASDFETKLQEFWEKTTISENELQEFATTYTTDPQRQSAVRELLQKTKEQQESFDMLVDNAPLEVLMGPHLCKDDLNLEPVAMAQKFGKYDTNVEEILGFGKSDALVKGLDNLGRNIQAGIPVFSVKSEELTDSDDGLWKCSCQNSKEFLKEIITGKSASELIGPKTKEGGYEHVKMSPTFQRLFQVDAMSEQMKLQGIPEEVRQGLKQEDLDYFQKILFDEALSPGNITPEALEKINTKTASLIDCLAGTYIGRSLWWNLFGNPKSTVLDMIFSIGNMALDAGGDLYRHQMAQRIAYTELFEHLKNDYNKDPKTTPQQASQKALVDAATIFVKIEKLSKEMTEHLTKTEQWRGLGLDMANRTKEHNDAAIKKLEGSAKRFATSLVIGAVLLGTTGWLTALPATLLALTGMGIGTYQTGKVTHSTMHMRAAAGKYLPPANNAVARADAAAQDAHKSRRAMIEAALNEIKTKIRGANEIDRPRVQQQEQEQQQEQQEVQPVHSPENGIMTDSGNTSSDQVQWPRIEIPHEISAPHEIITPNGNGGFTTRLPAGRTGEEKKEEEELVSCGVPSTSVFFSNDDYTFLHPSKGTVPAQEEEEEEEEKKEEEEEELAYSSNNESPVSSVDSGAKFAAPIGPRRSPEETQNNLANENPITRTIPSLPISPFTRTISISPIVPPSRKVEAASNGPKKTNGLDLKELAASSVPATPTPTPDGTSGVQDVPTSKSHQNSGSPRKPSLKPW